MKRSAPNDESSNKRVRTDPSALFDDPILARDAEHLRKQLSEGIVDETGYIVCRVFMVWKPTKGKRKIVVEMTGEVEKHRFNVDFIGAFADFFAGYEIKGHDEIMLAMKGVEIKEAPESSGICNFPLKLQYTYGVIVKFVKRRGETIEVAKQILNTWELQEEVRRAEERRAANEWFLPPPISPKDIEVEDIGTPTQPPNIDTTSNTPIHKRSTSAPPVKLVRSASSGVKTKQQENPVPIVSALDTTAYRSELSPPVESAVASQKPELSKKKQRKLQREQRAALQAASRDASLTTPAADTPPVVATPEPEVSKPAEVTLSECLEVSRPTPKSEPIGPLGLKAGFSVGLDTYNPLNALRNGSCCNVMGVVSSASLPNKTRRGDWMCNVKIVDPSNTDLENLCGPEGFQTNCFTKRYEQWLPRPTIGEILILRDVKISTYHGNPIGTGYSDKLQWAIFSPVTGKINHGTLKDTPKSERLAEGRGYVFSPFFQPQEPVIRYCLKLSDWWLEVSKYRKAALQGAQIGDGEINIPFNRVQRKHRLISEASPDAPPSGYFDCTVEVLYGHMNDSRVYSLYVTDYTKNAFTMPVQAEWCADRLSEYVLKIEVWDEAIEHTQTMRPGEYYSIKNARMRTSQGGFLEGKLVQDKIRQLEEEEESHDSHFKALLKRKAAWEKDNSDGTSLAQNMVYQTIETAPESEHFNCVVEVLHIVLDDKDIPHMYVTDYTPRQDLVSSTESWAAGLDGYILKIILRDNQFEAVKSAQAGAVCTIKKLRLKQSTTNLQIQGQLGGEERLIFILDTTYEGADGNVDNLKQRKENWQKRVTIENNETNDQKNPKRRPWKTIAVVKASEKCPNKFRIYARVVGLYPQDLRDAVIVHCTKCNQDLLSSRRACLDCEDFEHEYVCYKYQMFVRLQDEEGSRLEVSVHDKCPLFEGLKRVDIRDDRSAYDALINRLSTVVGNLVEFQEMSHKEPPTALNTPILSLILDSWEVDGQKAYCLARCEDLEK